VTTRIDSHHHFWDIDSGAYDWPTPAEGVIYRTFQPADLEPELERAGIDATIVVQTVHTVEDTDSMLAAMAAHPWIAGVVGWAPLDDVRNAAMLIEPRLDRGLRGIRHLVHHEVDPDWIVRPSVADGLALLERLGLPFDVVGVFPNHLRHVPALADRYPRLTLVIDHLANPPIRGQGWRVWREQLQSAAQRPNVVAKVSGLDTAAGPGWTVDELRPSVEAAIDAFGPDRLMFGSDWPVCRMVGSFGAVASAAERLLGALSPDEQARVFGGTAVQVYRLSR